MDTKYLGYRKCKKLLKHLVNLLEEALGGNLLAFAIFGSVARGRGSGLSDIDLLVVHKEDRKLVERAFLEATARLRKGLEYKKLVEREFLPDPYPIFMDEAHLKTHPWILLDIMDHGIILLDRNKVLKIELKLLKRKMRELGTKKVILEDGTWYWDLKPDWRPGEIIEI